MAIAKQGGLAGPDKRRMNSMGQITRVDRTEGDAPAEDRSTDFRQETGSVEDREEIEISVGGRYVE
jgi:hypothetical protein